MHWCGSLPLRGCVLLPPLCGMSCPPDFFQRKCKPSWQIRAGGSRETKHVGGVHLEGRTSIPGGGNRPWVKPVTTTLAEENVEWNSFCHDRVPRFLEQEEPDLCVTPSPVRKAGRQALFFALFISWFLFIIYCYCYFVFISVFWGKKFCPTSKVFKGIFKGF